MNKDFKLCYIEKCWAYFTTQDLDKQWGDDWDDTPYEHNAGLPYEWYDGKDGPRYEITKLAFEANGTAQPCEVGNGSSPFSVKGINKGVCAWLWTDDVVINAGCSIDEFKQKIKLMGGDVYEKST